MEPSGDRKEAATASSGFEMRRIEHVQLAMPAGEEDRARSFYGELLGMDEVDKPPALAVRGGCWFARGDAQLHLGVEEGFTPARKAHPALVVRNLDALRSSLEAAGVETTSDDGVAGWYRIHAHDPFGNRLEFMEPKGQR